MSSYDPHVDGESVERVVRSGGVLAPDDVHQNSSAVMMDYFGDCITYRFVFDTLVIGCLCLLGIVGNILSIAVMQKDNSSQVATFLLQSLAIADIFVLTLSYVVLSVMCGLLPFINHQEWTAHALPYLIKYVNPFAYITHSWAIWITVLIAVNRFIAITRPLNAPFLCTLSKVRIQVLLVILFGTLFNIPRFFQNDVVFVQLPNSTVKVPALNSTIIGDHSIFGKVYTNALYTICVLILPLFILTVVNYKLIKEIRKAKQLRESMSATPTKESSKSSGEENNVTIVMVIIVVVFLVCHTPDRILQIIRVALPSLKPQCGTIMYYLSDSVNLLIIINSSTNFVIYYFLRKRFRKILMTRICAIGSSISASTPSWSKYKADGNELSLLPALQLKTPEKVHV